MNLAFWDPFFFILTLGNVCSSLLIALGDVSWGSSYQVLFLKYCKLFLHSLKALHELRCTVGSMFLLTVENYGDDTNLQKFFGEAIWFMVIWKTHIVCLCFHSLQYNMTLKQWWHTNEFNFWGEFWFGLDPHRNHLRTFPTQQQNLTRATNNEDKESQLVEFPTKCPSMDGPN